MAFAFAKWHGNSFGGCMYVRLSICMYVCNMMTFESLVVENSFLVCRYILRRYGSS